MAISKSTSTVEPTQTYSLRMDDKRGAIGDHSPPVYSHAHIATFECGAKELAAAIRAECHTWAHCEIAPVVGEPTVIVSYILYNGPAIDLAEDLRHFAAMHAIGHGLDSYARRLVDSAAEIEKKADAPISTGEVQIRYSRRWMQRYAE